MRAESRRDKKSIMGWDSLDLGTCLLLMFLIARFSTGQVAILCIPSGFQKAVPVMSRAKQPRAELGARSRDQAIWPAASRARNDRKEKKEEKKASARQQRADRSTGSLNKYPRVRSTCLGLPRYEGNKCHVSRPRSENKIEGQAHRRGSMRGGK